MEMLSRSSDSNSNISHKYIALALRRLHSYSTPSTGAKYCDENVCLSAQISPKPYIRMSPKFRCMLCDHGSVVLWQNCDNMCFWFCRWCHVCTERTGIGLATWKGIYSRDSTDVTLWHTMKPTHQGATTDRGEVWRLQLPWFKTCQ